jgi:CHASE1-domain containing sensor protein
MRLHVCTNRPGAAAVFMNTPDPRLAPVMVLVSGLVVAALAGWQQHRANDVVVQERLQALAENVAERVRRRLRLYEYGLRGVRSAVIVAGRQAQELSREDFRRLGLSQDIPHQYPGISGFAFARRVPRGQESAVLAEMRRSGWPDAQIQEAQPHAGDHFVAQYIEPMETNAKALGYDIMSERQAARGGRGRDPQRRAAHHRPDCPGAGSVPYRS